jgi:hypothetical protein
VRVALAVVLLATRLGAQSTSLSGTITARETGEPLAYAIVGIEGMDRAQFAGDSGTFFFGDLGFGSVRLQVRRLGFQPFDTTLFLVRGATTNVRVALRRVAVRLSEVDVRAHPPCRKPGPPPRSDSALVSIFTQMKMNAEQYELLTREYPLVYVLEVQKSSRLKSDGSTRVDSLYMDRFAALRTWRYRPGQLVVRKGTGHYVNIPMIVDFADKSFIANHCFHYGGLAHIDQDTAIRLDVVAAQSLRTNDVSGSIYLDPETFQVRRTVLQLTMPLGRFGSIVDFEISTDFREVLQSIPVIWRLEAVQRLDPRARAVDFDEAYETQQLKGYQFLQAKPGDRKRQGRT